MNELSLARFKRCTKCGITYPATTDFFYPAKGRAKYGLYSRCSACVRRIAKDGYWANPKKYRETSRNWAEKNPEKIKAARHTAYWKDIGKSREYLRRKAKERYDRDPEAVLARNRAWNAANKAWVRQSKLSYKAKKRAAGGGYTFDEVWQMYEDQQGFCAYCETPLFGSFHVDHMLPISRGGSNTWENLAVTCDRCNLRKHTRTAEEWMMVLME